MTLTRSILSLTLGALFASSSFAAAVAVDETLDTMYETTVDREVVDFIADTLPEGTVNPEFVNPDYDGYLQVGYDNTTANVTFISEGAGYKNSVGYFTFSDTSFDNLSKSDIDTNGNNTVSLEELSAVNGVQTGWLYPNTSQDGGLLTTGDTVDITGLMAGDNLGFFLLGNAWNGNTSTVNTDAYSYYSLDFLNPESWKGTTMVGAESEEPSWWRNNTINNDVGWDETGAMTHTALLSDQQTSVILAFEDLLGGGDRDYNDAVFLITADPPESFGSSNIATAPVPLLSAGPIGLLGTLALMVYGRPRKRAA